MNNVHGEEVWGVAQVTGTGDTEIKLYKMGSTTQRVIAATEFLSITDVSANVATGADTYIKWGSGAVATTTTVVRKTLANNGDIDLNYIIPRMGPRAAKPYFIGGAGVNSVQIHGFILKG